MMDDKKENDKFLINVLNKSAIDLLEYVNYVNNNGGINQINNLYEHAICDCVSRIGDGTKRLKTISFESNTQKIWTGVRIITAHKYEKLDLKKIWNTLPEATNDFISECNILLLKIDEDIININSKNENKSH